MKTFDEWFFDAYGCTFDQKANCMSLLDAMRALTNAFGEYATYAAFFHTNEQ